ncbi:CPBP family intramembrane glutamic endopeptidase [Jeotgalibaca sp. A122]|uniref:CPBP family intramembrane glutamic endopeptidase n=1 Tax=Jeotgalibaca sp. A122 TaxID=3457322 RepID=UPI003FD4672D
MCQPGDGNRCGHSGVFDFFALARIEQGFIGVVTTYIYALFFSYIRYEYDKLWAAVLAHGFLNSIGIITFFFTGPLYGLW